MTELKQQITINIIN